ncbi:hypothetical protein [Fulvivirga lutea]|uniref:Uncharacterized protein n=1 Tax=Fulvivirga lutea TaxID=2810512 RepID=A0A974WFL8_9BACT|nr:hypothetical protein [Fulvivirga lutea]QSE96623.1 hypothetical protein JR347_13595 [Fulvivirga lutea]
MGVLNADLWWYVVPTLLALLAVLVFLESKNGRLYLSRLVATVVALISIVLLYLEPYYFSEVDADTIIITTKEANKVDSLRVKYPNNKFIEWSDTIRTSDLTNHVIVNGYGIPEYDLYKLKGKKVDFIAAEIPNGIIDVCHQSEVILGENQVVQLRVNQLENTWLKLSMLGGVVDSVMVQKDSIKAVTLNYKPLVSGKTLLNITAEAENTVIQLEQLPVIVYQPDKSDVLILNDHPTFETKFLKNHLIAQGHRVFVRSKITTDRYRHENSGFEFDKLPYLSESLLGEFDVLIIPANDFFSLSRNERLNIEKQVKERGLGLLLLASNASDKIPDWINASFNKLEDDKQTMQLGKESVEIESIVGINSNQPLSECHLSINDVCFNLSQPLGLGKVGILSIINTFKLSLNGNETQYQLLWDKILSKFIYKQMSPLTIESQLVYLDEPNKLWVINNGAPKVAFDSVRLTFRQHEFIDDRWQTTIWPRKAGWNNIVLSDKPESKWQYVFQQDEWSSVKNYQTLILNASYFNSINDYAAKEREVKKLISKWWFLLLFLVSMGYLWLEPKLR